MECQFKMLIRATALTGAGGRRWVGVEGKVASSVLGPGTQALLAAGVCGQSLAGRVLSCALPYHLSGLALVWSLYYRDIGACWVVL